MNPSICIPKLEQNINSKFIATILKKHNLGEIKKIDLIPFKKGQRAFIHFNRWYNNEKSIKVKNILLSGKDFKIMYIEPWFWKCTYLYKNKK